MSDYFATQVLLVGSGKGGVGKSTLSTHLSVALANQGYSIGLLDADLYGPSIPQMLGLHNLSPPLDEKRLSPFYKYGVHTLSLGNFLSQDQALSLRGPALHSLLTRLLFEVHWPKLDLLVVDLPPGTGDVPMSLCQLLPVSATLAITTSQKVALSDTLRAINSWVSLNLPTLGLVENMSGSYLGAGGAEELAKRLHMECLAQIPLINEVVNASDEGRPITTTQTEASAPFFELGETVAALMKLDQTKLSIGLGAQ